MAISVSVAALAGAIRAGSTALETAEITRIRLYAIEAITRHLGAVLRDGTPETVRQRGHDPADWIYLRQTDFGPWRRLGERWPQQRRMVDPAPLRHPPGRWDR